MSLVLNDVMSLPDDERVGPLLELAGGEANGGDAQQLIGALLAVVHTGSGNSEQRVAVGELLARYGDPRLRTPSDPEYFVNVPVHQEPLLVGRYPVTMAEFRGFVASKAYHDDANWSEEGLAWRNANEDTWADRVAGLDARLTASNQPAIYVNWYEAQAYATASSARLPSQMERLHVMRGEAKRPYPWGAPFGSGNANTAEEVLKRPCAVGLYHRDSTPEGVMDLAGNVAEWLGDDVAPNRIIHPGAWSQPSMAAWAKARFLIDPDFRGPDLGFRLVRDS